MTAPSWPGATTPYGQATAPAGDDFVAIAAGQDFSIALLLRRQHRRLGPDDPACVGTGFTAISASHATGLALRGDGQPSSSGLAARRRPGTGYTAVAAGPGFGLALRGDGSIAGWGANSDGQASPPAGSGYLAIEAGYHHGVAIRADGSVAAWGLNNKGQATAPSGTGFVAVDAGWDISVALVHDTTAPDTTIISGPSGTIAYLFFDLRGGLRAVGHVRVQAGPRRQLASSPVRVGYLAPGPTPSPCGRSTRPATSIRPLTRASSRSTGRAPTSTSKGRRRPGPTTRTSSCGFSARSPEPAVAFECAFVGRARPVAAATTTGRPARRR